MAFDIKTTPILPFVSHLFGYIIDETKTDVDNEIVAELKKAIDEAEGYEGDIEDLIEELFDVIEWGFDEIPAFRNTVVDDIALPFIEDFLKGIISGGGGFTFFKAALARMRARRAKRRERRKNK